MHGVNLQPIRLSSKFPAILGHFGTWRSNVSGPERTADLYKLCGLPDFHAKDWNNKTPFKISQTDRIRARPLSAVLAGYRDNCQLENCQPVLPTDNCQPDSCHPDILSTGSGTTANRTTSVLYDTRSVKWCLLTLPLPVLCCWLVQWVVTTSLTMQGNRKIRF